MSTEKSLDTLEVLVILLFLTDGVDSLGGLTYQPSSPWSDIPNPISSTPLTLGLVVVKDRLYPRGPGPSFLTRRQKHRDTVYMLKGDRARVDIVGDRSQKGI